MGSSASIIANDDGTITIAKSAAEDLYQKFRELENKLKEAENLNKHLTSKNNISQSLLSKERVNNSSLNTIVVGLKNKISSLEINAAASKSESANKEKQNNQLVKHVAELGTQISEKQQIIGSLNINIKEVKDKLEGAEQLINNLTLQSNSFQSKLSAETRNNDFLHTKVVGLKNKIKSLEDEVAAAKSETSNIKNHNSQLNTHIAELKTQISDNRRYVAELNMKIKETQENPQSIKILTNKCTELEAQKNKLDRELTQLKNNKLLAIEAALDDLSKRAGVIRNKILKTVKNNNRENFTTKFQTLKDENDAMIKNLKTVTFPARLYQRHHDALLKLQDETDKRCMGTLKTIHEITNDCKKLFNDYNVSVPDNFQKAIGDHTRAMDMLENVNFNSAFAKEEAVQQEILSGLSHEKGILEGILNVEKSNNNTNQVGNEKPNNLNYITSPGSNKTYDLVVYNMAEENDDYDDIVCFETFMQHVTGRKIDCFGVQRFGILSKSPRPAKITLKSLRDFDDVLNSKPSNFGQYRCIRIGKYNANKK